MGYSEAELGDAGEGANLGPGCGNPLAIAALRAGEVVVDLGSGAGFDGFLAARLGLENVEFHLGEIAHLLLADEIADAVISNCVINLVPEKKLVFQEAFRLLGPGGRLAIADVGNVSPHPPELAADPMLLAGCVSGAASGAALAATLRAPSKTFLRSDG